MPPPGAEPPGWGELDPELTSPWFISPQSSHSVPFGASRAQEASESFVASAESPDRLTPSRRRRAISHRCGPRPRIHIRGDNARVSRLRSAAARSISAQVSVIMESRFSDLPSGTSLVFPVYHTRADAASISLRPQSQRRGGLEILVSRPQAASSRMASVALAPESQGCRAPRTERGGLLRASLRAFDSAYRCAFLETFP